MGSGSSRRYPPQPGWESSEPPRLQPFQYTQNTGAPGAPGVSGAPGGRNRKRFSVITDDYHTLDQVQFALRRAGLESSNLIVGIDFTKSNEWTGKHSFYGQSLHAVGAQPNPYEQTISIIGRTLAAFDEDNLIPCFGFGDSSTHDQSVFSFFPDHRPCNGFDEALARYRQIAPNLKLSGPTSFAPIIEAAMRTVEQSRGQYHVLVIIADGQVTTSVERGVLSHQEKATMDAIVRASSYPLSILLVGVGDGPWEMMREFDDRLPARAFDNFQFVNFSDVMARNAAPERKEAAFALNALMEIPQQYKLTIENDLLGRPTGHVPSRDPLPPPPAVLQADLRAGGQGVRPQQAYPAAPNNYPGGGSQSDPSYPYSKPSQGIPSYPPSKPSQGTPSYPPSKPSQGNPSYPPSKPSQGNPSYPPTAYPPAGQPTGTATAYPAAGYPPSGYPPSGYPPAGYPGGKKK